jgi:hypothetical protein
MLYMRGIKVRLTITADSSLLAEDLQPDEARTDNLQTVMLRNPNPLEIATNETRTRLLGARRIGVLRWRNGSSKNDPNLKTDSMETHEKGESHGNLPGKKGMPRVRMFDGYEGH